MTADEQELHINYYPTETGKSCEVYTTIPWLIKYLDKMVREYPDDYTLLRSDEWSITVSIPFKLVKPRKPVHYSPERIAKQVACMRKKYDTEKQDEQA